MPTGNTGVSTQIKLLTVLAIARLKVFSDDKDSIDPYWTLVSYYNSLKDVGRMSNKVGDELQQSIQNEQSRLKFQHTLQFNFRKLKTRSKELTSRIDSSKIKKTLGQLEKSFALDEVKGYFYPRKDLVDLVLATNMLSVGIDIARLNVMQINGMPRNTSEYIQASSRVGRKDKGLVIPLFDSNRARDKSHFENFLTFHQSLYKQIEPLSITPFTENTIEKMISSLFISYIRHKKGHYRNTDILKFKRQDSEQFKEMLKNRFPDNPNTELAINKIDHLANDWLEKIEQEDPYEKYSGEKNALLTRPGLKTALNDTKWVVMQSMRDIDSSSFIKINPNFEKRS
jgi:superfamily II DNA/RNA helicase